MFFQFFVCTFENSCYICNLLPNSSELPMAKQIDILCNEQTLYNAWNVVKAKGAAGGIDGVFITDIHSVQNAMPA